MGGEAVGTAGWRGLTGGSGETFAGDCTFLQFGRSRRDCCRLPRVHRRRQEADPVGTPCGWLQLSRSLARLAAYIYGKSRGCGEGGGDRVVPPASGKRFPGSPGFLQLGLGGAGGPVAIRRCFGCAKQGIARFRAWWRKRVPPHGACGSPRRDFCPSVDDSGDGSAGGEAPMDSVGSVKGRTGTAPHHAECSVRPAR